MSSAVIVFAVLAIILLLLALFDLLSDACILPDVVAFILSAGEYYGVDHYIERYRNPKLFWFCFLLELIGGIICLGLSIWSFQQASI